MTSQHQNLSMLTRDTTTSSSDFDQVQLQNKLNRLTMQRVKSNSINQETNQSVSSKKQSGGMQSGISVVKKVTPVVVKVIQKVSNTNICSSKEGSKQEPLKKEKPIEQRWIKVKIQGFSGRYKGQWSKNLPHGQGEFIHAMDGTEYLGDFYYGYKHGYGVESYPCGSRYSGDFDEGFLNGKAIYEYENGDKYEGNFFKGFREGHGVLHYISGDIYEGKWQEDEKHGEGKYTFRSGNHYQGDWINGLKDGEGSYTYANGVVFRGKYKDDQRHGMGRIFDQNDVKVQKMIYEHGKINNEDEDAFIKMNIFKQKKLSYQEKKDKEEQYQQTLKLKIYKVPTCNILPNISLPNMGFKK